MNPIRLLSVAIVGVAACSAVAARPVAMLDSAELVRRADTIVGADVIERRDATASVDLRATAVLAGDAMLTGHTLRLQLAPAAAVRLPDGYALYFLKCEAASCTAVDVEHPALPAVPRSAAWAPQASTTERVAEELVRVLTIDGRQPADSTMAARLEHAVSALYTLPTDAVRTQLQRAKPCTSLACRMAMTAARIQIGDYSTLDDVAPQMLSASTDSAFTRHGVAWRIAYRSPLPEALIPAMSTWLRSEDVFVRQQAAAALADIRSDRIVAPLRTLALGDTDQLVRYYAVSGLAGVTGVGETPLLTEYRASEQTYLTFWKSPTR